MFAYWLELVARFTPWLVGISLVSLLLGALLVPAMIVRLPVDYFLHDRRHSLRENARHPAVRLAISSAKNVIGAVLLCAGIAMLFLPGQGLLTLFAGILVMNYPGKFRFERWLIRRRGVFSAINWLRSRAGKAPLISP